MVLIIIFLIIVAFSYAIMFHVVKKDVEGKIKSYSNTTIWKEGIVNMKVANELLSNKKEISTFVALGWPLYYFFLIGSEYGTDIYEIIMGNDYENRVASWLI